MITGHRLTWLSWLTHLSPMARTLTNHSQVDRAAMAEALSIAAPLGPVGVTCEDDCRCSDGAAIAAKLLQHELGELSAKMNADECRRLADAIESDIRASSGRVDHRVIADLACGVRTHLELSAATQGVAAARAAMPRTHDVLRTVIQ